MTIVGPSFSGTHSPTPEMTEFLIVLNSNAALKSFMAAGNITVGGGLSVAVGPIGRHGEFSGNINTKGKVAAMYSYSRSKGLFGGVSIEGSVIMERQDANAKAYHTPGITVKSLLTGQVPGPPWASGLYETLSKISTGYAGWVDDAPPTLNPSVTGTDYAFGRTSSTPSFSQGSTGPFGSGESVRRSRVDAIAIKPAITGRAWSDIDDEEEERMSQFRSPTSLTQSESNRIRSEDPFEAPQTRQRSQTFGFATHFDSDFDPVRDGSHHRTTPSLSSPSHFSGGSPPPYSGASHTHTPEKLGDPFDHNANGTTIRPSFTGGRSSYSISSARTGGGLSRVSSPGAALAPQFTSSQPTRGLDSEIAGSIANGFEHAIALYDYKAQEVRFSFYWK